MAGDVLLWPSCSQREIVDLSKGWLQFVPGVRTCQSSGWGARRSRGVASRRPPFSRRPPGISIAEVSPARGTPTPSAGTPNWMAWCAGHRQTRRPAWRRRPRQLRRQRQPPPGPGSCLRWDGAIARSPASSSEGRDGCRYVYCTAWLILDRQPTWHSCNVSCISALRQAPYSFLERCFCFGKDGSI